MMAGRFDIHVDEMPSMMFTDDDQNPKFEGVCKYIIYDVAVYTRELKKEPRCQPPCAAVAESPLVLMRDRKWWDPILLRLIASHCQKMNSCARAGAKYPPIPFPFRSPAEGYIGDTPVISRGK